MKNKVVIEGNVAKVYYTNCPNEYFICDKEDLEIVALRKWHKHIGYPTARINKKTALFHRLVMKCPEGKEVDHIDRNRWNNCKSNLRIVSHLENMGNRPDTSKYGAGIYKYPDDFYIVFVNKNYICATKSLSIAKEARKKAFALYEQGNLTPFHIDNIRKSIAKK